MNHETGLVAKKAILQQLKRRSLKLRIRLACGGLSFVDRLRISTKVAALAAQARNIAATPADQFNKE